MEKWLVAGLWGWLAGSALLLGAVIGYYVKLSNKTISSVMAFGSGVLVSAISFELMDEAIKNGEYLTTSVGFFVGALVYTLAAREVDRRGARYRKRSSVLQPTEEEQSGSGTAIAIGALLDGIPESIAIGITLIYGESVSLVAVFAIFLSNLPEGLSSSNGMKKAGRSREYVLLLWGGIAFISGIASIVGYLFFGQFGDHLVSLTMSFAAGAILSMIVNTMIPEAYEEEKDWTGIITAFGFLVSFLASHYA